MLDRRKKYRRISFFLGIMGVVFLSMGLSFVFFTDILNKNILKEGDKMNKKMEVAIQNDEIEEEKM